MTDKPTGPSSAETPRDTPRPPRNPRPGSGEVRFGRDEFELIEWMTDEFGLTSENETAGREVTLGIGDDCAEIRVRVQPGMTSAGVLITTDTVIEGVHFTWADEDARRIGRKAVLRAASDVNAMLGTAHTIVVAAILPYWLMGHPLAELVRGIAEAARELGVAVVGGDTARSGNPLTLNVTVLGAPLEGGSVRRAGAEAGDAIFVTGQLGGGAHHRWLDVPNRSALPRWILELCRPTAAIDVSDGLAQDLGHILDASGGLGAALEASALPLSDAARAIAATSGREPWYHACADGEAYELCLTIPGEGADRVARSWDHPVPLTRIGTVLPAGEPRVIRIANGRTEPFPTGWRHTTSTRFLKIKPE